MPGTIDLKVRNRASSGSAEARRMRRAGELPAVLYGGGEETVLVLETFEFMKKIGYASAAGMVTLVDPDGAKTTAIIKEVQWNRLTDKPLHVDFYRVSLDQIVEVKVPLHFEGTPKGLLFGGVFDQLMHEVTVKVKASSIPPRISVDVSDLGIGDALHVRDLVLPEGVKPDTSADLPIAHVVPPTVEKAKPAAEAAVEETAAAPAVEEDKKKKD